MISDDLDMASRYIRPITFAVVAFRVVSYSKTNGVELYARTLNRSHKPKILGDRKTGL